MTKLDSEAAWKNIIYSYFLIHMYYLFWMFWIFLEKFRFVVVENVFKRWNWIPNTASYGPTIDALVEQVKVSENDYYQGRCSHSFLTFYVEALQTQTNTVTFLEQIGRSLEFQLDFNLFRTDTEPGINKVKKGSVRNGCVLQNTWRSIFQLVAIWNRCCCNMVHFFAKIIFCFSINWSFFRLKTKIRSPKRRIQFVTYIWIS